MKVVVNLKDGHVPLEGEDRTPQKRIVISRRPTGADLFRINRDEQSQLNINFELMMTAACITEFGNLSLPVPLGVLLKLKAYDRQALSEGRNVFLAKTLGERITESLSDEKVRLAFGLTAGGQVYDIVEFGNVLTGFDELEVERQAEKGTHDLPLLLMREIKSLSKSGDEDGAAGYSGPFDISMFEEADWLDMVALSEARQRWRNSFRNSCSITVED